MHDGVSLLANPKVEVRWNSAVSKMIGDPKNGGLTGAVLRDTRDGSEVDFPVDGVQDQIESLVKAFPFLDHFWAGRLVRTYGTDAAKLLEGATSKEDLGEDFGATLTEAEVDWLFDHEFAQTAEDILWRRTKLGLRLSPSEADWLEQCILKQRDN